MANLLVTGLAIFSGSIRSNARPRTKLFRYTPYRHRLSIKFNVLALDYDDTIANHGRLRSDVALAIREARAKGITVALVTERNFGPPARTLKKFVNFQSRMPVESIESHARRSDFSRWTTGLFTEQPLADAIVEMEEQFRREQIENLSATRCRPIPDRYELCDISVGASTQTTETKKIPATEARP